MSVLVIDRLIFEQLGGTIPYRIISRITQLCQAIVFQESDGIGNRYSGVIPAVYGILTVRSA